MKVKVKVPFVFMADDIGSEDSIDIGSEDSMHIFDNLPRPMQARVIDSLQRKREQLAQQVNFTEHAIDVLGSRQLAQQVNFTEHAIDVLGSRRKKK